MVRERARDNNKVNDHHGAIAKWLRRLIRNQFPFRGAGSNPAGVVENRDRSDVFFGCFRLSSCVNLTMNLDSIVYRFCITLKF